MRVPSALVLAACCALSGCVATEQVPPYAWRGAHAALADLQARANAIRSVQSQGLMTLRKPDGDTATFDVALLAAAPDRLRIRAWKFGHAAFDLTMSADELWVWTSSEARDHEPDLGPRLSARAFTDAWTIFAGSFFATADSRVISETADVLRLERSIDGTHVTCEIRKSTLTPRAYEFFDEKGLRRGVLTLDEYRLLGTVSWPSVIHAESAVGGILLELEETEVNGELPREAFVHPVDAIKQP